MIEKKKHHQVPKNIVYVIDGSSYGLDDGLVDAIRTSITKRIESKTLDVPRLPQVAAKIMQLSESPSTDVEEIARTISTDPVLATRVLTVANSSAYATGGRVEGLMPAMMRLGTKVVCEMVFSESIRLKIFSVRSYRSILEQSWRLSLGTAIACEAISTTTGLERDGAFLMGLLHDTGKPVLANAIVETEKQNQGRALGEETVEILMSQLHEEIGAYVLKSWEMPEPVVTAAGGHHRYLGTTQSTSAHRLVYAGNLVCQHLGIGDQQREIDFTIERVFSDLNLADTDKMTRILERVNTEVQSVMVEL